MRACLIFFMLLCPCLFDSFSMGAELPSYSNAGPFTFIKNAARKGHPKAAYYLATYYYHGNGVAVNKQMAAHWFKKSALAGIAEAQFAYGMLLLSGDGVDIDKPVAFEWLGKAARQDYLPARQVLKELLTYRGTSPLGVGGALSTGYLEKLTEQERADRLRIDGKGVLLDRGSFGLKFSLPPLVDPLSTGTTPAPKLNQMLERLQGGTVDIIIRP